MAKLQALAPPCSVVQTKPHKSRAPPSSAVCLQVHFSCTAALRTVALCCAVVHSDESPANTRNSGTKARGKWVSTGHALGVKVSWTLRRMFAMHPDHRSSAGSDHVLWNLFAWLFLVLESALLVKRVGAGRLFRPARS